MQLVRIWDLPTRLFHWMLVVLCLTMMITGHAGWLHWHMLLGPAVLVLVLFRLIWGLVGSTTSRFGYFVKSPAAMLEYVRRLRRGQVWTGLGHNPMGAASVLVLLVLPLIMVGTGLFTSDDIYTDGPLVPLVSSHMVKLLSGLHRLTGVAVMAMVALHLAAIAFYHAIKREDLIGPMVSGWGERPVVPLAERAFVPAHRAAVILVLLAVLVWQGLALVTPLAE